jgi:hypothetical protein
MFRRNAGAVELFLLVFSSSLAGLTLQEVELGGDNILGRLILKSAGCLMVDRFFFLVVMILESQLRQVSL